MTALIVTPLYVDELPQAPPPLLEKRQPSNVKPAASVGATLGESESHGSELVNEGPSRTKR